MEVHERIAASQIRVRSGIRLVAFLLVVVIASALLGIVWLAKLGGGAAAFFALVTAVEYWNVRRLKGKSDPPGDTPPRDTPRSE
jgi:Na+/proline symporter